METISALDGPASLGSKVERHRNTKGKNGCQGFDQQRNCKYEPKDRVRVAAVPGEYGQRCTDGENRPKSQEFTTTAGFKGNIGICDEGSREGCGQLRRISFGGQKSQDSGASRSGTVNIALTVIDDDEPEKGPQQSRRYNAARRSEEAGRMATSSGVECSTNTTTKSIAESLTLGAAEINNPQRRAKSSFSPGAFRERGLAGLRNLLALGSEAQVSPASSPPSLTIDSKRLELRAMFRSPVRWSSVGLKRGKGLGNKIAPNMYDGAMVGAELHEPDRGKVSTVQDNTLTAAADEICAPSRQMQVEGKRNIAEQIKMAKEAHLVCDDGRKVHATTSIHRELLPGKRSSVHNVDFHSTLTAEIGDAVEVMHCRSATKNVLDDNHGAWPSPLDDEADPGQWALGEGERNILAAATRTGSVLVRVVTWNLHGQPTPGAEELKKTLLPPGKFHIFAVGTEECLNSIAKSLIVQSKKEWECLLKETLGASYEMLRGHSLQATHNAIFVHRGIIPLLRNVRSFAVATGLGLGGRGMTLGNKGGVGIAFNVGATACIFVNSHLAAHQSNVVERNEHFFQIQRGLVQALAPPMHLLEEEATRNSTEAGAEALVVPASPSFGALSPPKSFEEEKAGVEINTDENNDAQYPDQYIAAKTLEPGAASKSHNFASDSPERTENSRPPNPAKSATYDDRSKSSKGIDPQVKAQVPTSVSNLVEETSSSADPRSHSPQRSRRVHRRQGRHAVEGISELREGATLPETFDRVIWSGDLNYRINAPRAVVDLLIAKGMHEVLAKNDQLSLERGGGRGDGGSPSRAFAGYREGPLNFKPTYKFDSGTDMYDTSSKKRVPAWTDRVLFAERGVASEDEGDAGPGLDLRAYRSVADLKMSDHRPVLASFVMWFDAHGGDRDGEGSTVTNQTSSEVCCVM